MITDAVIKYAAIGAVIALSVLSAKLMYDKNQLNLNLLKVEKESSDARAVYASERSTMSQAHAKLLGEYRAIEQQLATRSGELALAREDNSRLAADAAAAVRDRLRAVRALSSLSAAAKVPGDAPAPAPQAYAVGTIGALLGERAEPMVGIAERADVLKGYLIECRANYESARELLQKTQTLN